MPEFSGGTFNMKAHLESMQNRIQEINRVEAMKCRAQLLGKNGEKIPPPTTPQQTGEFQVQAMIAAGFHKKIGMSDIQYRESLPKLTPPNEEILKLFPTPILVDTRIPISAQLGGFDDDITEHGESPDQIRNREGIITPQQPYIVWANDGSKYKGLSLKDVNVKLSPNERPLTFTELFSLQRADVELFFRDRPDYHNEGISISAGGSVSEKGRYPTMYHNYFPLKEHGEFQVDAFGDTSENYPHRPSAGWPTCWKQDL